MAHPLRSALSFVGVVGVALAATVTALSFTADTVARTAAETPPGKSNLRPSYVAFLPQRSAADFDISRTLPVHAGATVPSVPAVVPDAATPAFTHTVAASSLRVRTGPNKNTPQVFVLENGAQVTALRTERGWLEVRDRDGRTGWVYGKYLDAATTVATAE